MSGRRDVSKTWQLILQHSINRRNLLQTAGWVGASLSPLAAIGCKPRDAGQAGLYGVNADSVGIEGWLKAIDPILPAVLPQAGFSGDRPLFPHQTVRDSEFELSEGPADETTGVVVIGGGMSGLAAAYLLRGKKPIVLEQAANFGGNSRGESWEGIDFSIGAAYLVKLPDDDPLTTTFYKPLGLDNQWRIASEGPVAHQEKLYQHFWEGSTVSDPAGKAQIKKIKDYVKSVAAESYPEIPPEGEVPESLKVLDSRSFLDVLEEAAGGPLHAHVRALLEHYCWSSFGGSLDELSAASGLNFVAGEEDGICALPGGNAKVASLLLRATAAAGVPQENFRVSTIAVKVAMHGDAVRVQCQRADGSTYAIDAKAVVVACPKYVAKRIVADLPTEQFDAMNALNYRAYLVANALLDQSIDVDQYDIYLLGDTSENFADIKAAAEKQRATDVILGHWAGGGAASRSVLTLYRGFPYDGARTKLLKSSAYAQYRSEFLAQMPEILQTLGVSGNLPEDRLVMSRWGHPLVLSEVGLIADGTVERAHQAVGGKIFFCNQDDWALPAIETCLARAIQVATQVRAVL